MQINFNPEKHIYTLPNGEVLPSVTTLIKPLVDFSSVPLGVLERARLFGNGVHKTIELYLLEDLDRNSLDGPLEGCLRAFESFLEDYRYFFDEAVEIEKIGYHAKLKYAGKPDLNFQTRLIDIKSRKCNPLTDAIQAIMYDKMTGKGEREHYVLELYQEGNYVLAPLNTTARKRSESWSRARFLLDYYNATKEIERWK